jgi:hypothetical protein
LQVLNAKLKKSDDAFVPGALEKANLQVKKMSNYIGHPDHRTTDG